MVWQGASLGHADAQFELGKLYRDGKGVPKDEVKSYAWLLVAKANGIKESSEAVSSLEERLTAEQMEEGQAWAADLHRLKSILAY